MKPLGLKYAMLGLGSLAGLTLAVSAQSPGRSQVLEGGPAAHVETIVPVHVNEHQLLLQPLGPELRFLDAPPPVARPGAAVTTPAAELPAQASPYDFRQALVDEATQEGFAHRLAEQNLNFDEHAAAQRSYLSQVGVVEYARELARLRARDDYEAQRRLIREAAVEQVSVLRASSAAPRSMTPLPPAPLPLDARSQRSDLEQQLRIQQLQVEALESSTTQRSGPWHQVKTAGAWIAERLPFRSSR